MAEDDHNEQFEHVTVQNSLTDADGITHTGRLAEQADLDAVTDTRIDIVDSDGNLLVENAETLHAGDFVNIVATDGASAVIHGENTDTHVTVENVDGDALVSDVQAIQAGTDLQFVDDGDGTVTLNYVGSTSDGGNDGGGGGDTTSWEWTADFENASSAGDVYDQVNNPGNTAIITSGGQYSVSGSNSMRHEIVSGGHYGAATYYHFPEHGYGSYEYDPDQPDAVRTRVQMRLESGWNQPDGDTAKLYDCGMNASAGDAYGGGNGPPAGDDGWSVRIFSLGNTTAGTVDLAMYTYHMDQGGQYGTEETFTTVNTGEWLDIETYVEMNTVSGGSANYDGISRTWVNGTLEYERTDFRWRTRTDMGFDRFGPQTYYGGSMTSPETNYCYFDDNQFVVEAQ